VTLTPTLAQRIVDWLAISFDVSASVADPTARIIASTDPQLVGSAHPSARYAIACGALSAEGDTQRADIGLPIVFANAIVGAIVLNDTSARGHEIASVAKAFAELMIRQTAISDPFVQQRWARAKFIYNLLHAQLDSSLEGALQEAACLGIDLTIPRVVVVIDVKQLIEQHAAPGWADAVLPLIANMLRVEQSQIDLIEQGYRALCATNMDICTLVGDRWLVLLAVVDRSVIGGGLRLLDQSVRRFLDQLAQASGIMTSAGIGHAYPSWNALAQSFVDARFALEIGTRLHGAGQVFQIGALGLAGLIGGDDRQMKEALAQRLIGPISAEPDLLATLDAFLQAHLSPSLAAQSLHIHRHTLTYRLMKIAQVSGRDPRRFADAAELYAALLLWNMSGEARSAGQMAKK
jgi:carbohydrate diacid regulator